MNYMKENCPGNIRKRKTKNKDINFFQTVRDGTRRFNSKSDEAGVLCGPKSLLTHSSSSSIVGRTFIRSNKTTFIAEKKHESVIDILNKFSPPPSTSLSSKPSTEGFFQTLFVSPPTKRSKQLFSSTRKISDDQENIDTALPSKSYKESKIHSPRNPPMEDGGTKLFIDDFTEEECSKFRAEFQKMRAQQIDSSLINDDIPFNMKTSLEKRKDSNCVLADETCKTPENYDPLYSPARTGKQDDNSEEFTPVIENRFCLSSPNQSEHGYVKTPKESDALQNSSITTPVHHCIELSPQKGTFNMQNDKNKAALSPSFENLFTEVEATPDLPNVQKELVSPFLVPTYEHIKSSKSANPRKSFFSDKVSATQNTGSNSANAGSFFKIPETSSGSGSHDYDNLFSTPSRVTSLPRITTPQLFLPYPKPPNKQTPSQTKSSVKTTQSSKDSFYVISITEGRGQAMGEVGIASIDLNHPVLLLSQFSDSQTYKKALAKINVIDPAEILVPDTFVGNSRSVLYKTMTEAFPDVRVLAVKRQHYSAKLGLDTIRSLLLPDSSIEIMIIRKYYTLAAAEALIKYIEIKHGVLFSPKSLKVIYQSAKDVVSIDLETCQRLELVMANAEMIFPEKYSLFGLINHTKTLGGKRRLRVSLLQPSSSFDVIKVRQNVVTVLVNNENSLSALQTSLLKFSNVERLLWLAIKTPNFRNEAKTFESLTNYILLLKASLEAIPHLRKVLHDIDNDYITDIRDSLLDDKYEIMLKRICTMIHDDAKPARSFAEGERQRCFAIKEGINELLDVARATYSNLIQEVMDNISEQSREFKLPLRMVQSHDLGFHPCYTLPKNSTFNKDDIPEIFSKMKLKGRTVHLESEEIYIYNVRIKRVLQEIQLITNVVIYDLVESLREDVRLLYRLCDHISDLDVLSCLAQVSSTSDYTKPVFSDETSLLGVRHPILDHVRPTKPIPNNVFASKKKNFNIITGPNMGGKTVYVLMIPLIHIMAQIGCYVPADKAEIRITDHIYVKKGFTDNMECKLSSFSKEVAELTYTISNLTERSLIILDELCTGTLSDEGMAIAWGFCEELLKRPVFTFLTTHYHYLTNLSKVFSNVTNYHMEAVERTPKESEYGDLTYTYRLLPGVTNMTNYALRLMMSADLPESMKRNAIEIVENMAKRRAASLLLPVVPETPGTSKLHSKIDKVENFMKNLYGLSMTDNFTVNIVKTLQQMAIEEILSDEELSVPGKEDGEVGDKSIRKKSTTEEAAVAANARDSKVDDALPSDFVECVLENSLFVESSFNEAKPVSTNKGSNEPDNRSLCSKPASAPEIQYSPTIVPSYKSFASTRSVMAPKTDDFCKVYGDDKFHSVPSYLLSPAPAKDSKKDSNEPDNQSLCSKPASAPEIQYSPTIALSHRSFASTRTVMAPKAGDFRKVYGDDKFHSVPSYLSSPAPAKDSKKDSNEPDNRSLCSDPASAPEIQYSPTIAPSHRSFASTRTVMAPKAGDFRKVYGGDKFHSVPLCSTSPRLAKESNKGLPMNLSKDSVIPPKSFKKPYPITLGPISEPDLRSHDKINKSSGVLNISISQSGKQTVLHKSVETSASPKFAIDCEKSTPSRKNYASEVFTSSNPKNVTADKRILFQFTGNDIPSGLSFGQKEPKHSSEPVGIPGDNIESNVSSMKNTFSASFGSTFSNSSFVRIVKSKSEESITCLNPCEQLSDLHSS